MTHMRLFIVAAATSLALSGGVAFAAGESGNSTTTSMGAPSESPGDSAARSAVIPGVPPQERSAQNNNAAGGRKVDQGVTTPVQGPTNPATGRTQTQNP